MGKIRDQQLSTAWDNTKLAMLTWVTKSVRSMEPGDKAADVNNMLSGVQKLINVMGDMEQKSKASKDHKADAVHVESIGRRVGAALSQMKTGNKEAGNGEDDKAAG